MDENKQIAEFHDDVDIADLDTYDDHPISDDTSFEMDDVNKLIFRNQRYNEILDIYTKHLDSTKQIQKKYRIRLFWIFSIILLLIVIGTFVFICTTELTLTALPAVLGAIGTLIGSIMVIPSKITDFIFNPQEDEQMAKIIGDIQSYDKLIRENKRQNH